ncbi:hypothetical protein ACJJTC_004642 [Scirpophaga incertulas]
MNNIDLANDIDSIPDIECFEIIEADSFNTITLKALENRHCIIVAGDINIDILSPESNDYLCLNSEHGLEPAITKPTRLNACLDHIFIKTKGSVVGVVYDCDITDHKLAALGLNTFRVDSYQNACKVKTKTVVDNIGLCDFLASVDWYPVTTKSDVNESVGAFLGIMGNAIELNSRKVRISRSKINIIIRPWMTPGLLRCSRHKDKLHAKSKQNPKNEVLNISYRRYRNFYTDIVRKVRLAYERELLQRNSKNTKLLWKSTKDICYTKTSHPVSEKLLTITNDPKVSLNKCNDFFSSVGLNLANDYSFDIE